MPCSVSFKLLSSSSSDTFAISMRQLCSTSIFHKVITNVWQVFPGMILTQFLNYNARICCDSNSYFWNANWAWIRFRVVILIYISECKLFQSFCNFDGSWPLLSKCVSWHRSGEWISNAAWARIFICNESTKISGNLSSWFSKYVLVTKLSGAIPSCFDFAYFKSWKQCFLSWWVALEWV